MSVTLSCLFFHYLFKAYQIRLTYNLVKMLKKKEEHPISGTFPACFQIPIFFSNLNYNCSIFLDLTNLQEQVKKAFCYQKLFWPFTVWINCSSDLKIFANSRPSASNFKSVFFITRTIFFFPVTSRSEQFLKKSMYQEHFQINVYQPFRKMKAISLFLELISKFRSLVKS